jgi:uncharacterized membrane protein YccF (DUF307 family)
LLVAVVSLAFGIVFLPAPCLEVLDRTRMAWAVAGLVPIDLVFVVPLTRDGIRADSMDLLPLAAVRESVSFRPACTVSFTDG